MKQGVTCYVKITNQLSFETNFQKANQNTGGLQLLPSTKWRKDNQLESLKLSCRIS